MWIVAGVLLGSMVLAAIAGLHVGPHGHGLAAILGAVAAAWLLVMVVEGRGRPLLFVLLGADVVMSALLGLFAYKGLTDPARGTHRATGPEGAQGIALSDLDPLGIVRVRGEEWSAESVNGPVVKGGRVQVIGTEGVRVQVWGEDSPLAIGAPPEIDLSRFDGPLHASPAEPAYVERADGADPGGPSGNESEAES
jgi:membrane-bound ClpP family serine protease